MSRFGPSVLPSGGRALDFSSLSDALDRMGSRRSRRRAEETQDADLQLRIRGAGGRPVAEATRMRMDQGRRSGERGLDELLTPESRGVGRAPQPGGLPDVGLTPSDPYAGETGAGRTELGGVRSGASSRMVTTTGTNVAEYLRPYRMNIRGEEYEFDPMHSARVKAAETQFEEDAEIGRMRGLGMNDEQIHRAKYPDKSLTFPERRELKGMDIAGRAEVTRQRTMLGERRLRLEERRLRMLEAAENNDARYAEERMAYLREKLAFEEEAAKARLSMSDYGIEASLYRDLDRLMEDDETLAEADARLAAARARMRAAGQEFGNRPRGTTPAPARGAATATPRDSTRARPQNPYRR